MMPASDSNKIYDVFICHRNENKLWVEVLARNLKDYGYRIFLDIWDLVPGKHLTGSLYQALRQSSTGAGIIAKKGMFGL